NVSGQGIAGSIPINIQDLLHVTLLDLSHNQLSGKLPSGLSRLQGLLTLSLRSNYLYGGALPTSMCASSSSPLALSLHDNCFPSDAVPCALPHAQRPPLQCSAFCSLSPPSTPPCAGRGYCFWEGGEATGTATCACGPSFKMGSTPWSCDSILSNSECRAMLDKGLALV
ncbi:unnamed protein product, partial [Closterium sp. NIES-64]